MAQIAINRDELRNKIYGCWMGKNIGGTLGGPFEGRQDLLDVTGYVTPKGEPLPNDDLDLQLVWLKAVQERGPLGINNQVLGEYWLNFISPYWNEYGIGKGNMRAGLLPPLSGEYHNHWKHSNGAWIRSEIWACLAPGCPDIAIRYAYEDASVDHGGGEGTYAALFTAAVQSAAFVVSDRDELIKIGLSKIPADSRVAQSIGIAVTAYEEGLSWQDARNKVVEDSEDLGWFQAPANVAFVVIGWMYGEGDFGKSICIATSCGMIPTAPPPPSALPWGSSWAGTGFLRSGPNRLGTGF
jgi:ADP-ribosylglycohydrolase